MATTLVVDPINMAAPGSYRKRRVIFEAMAAMKAGVSDRDGFVVVESLLALDEVVQEHIHTDNGTDIGEVLDVISAEDFDALLGSVLGEEPVPTESGAA